MPCTILSSTPAALTGSLLIFLERPVPGIDYGANCEGYIRFS